MRAHRVVSWAGSRFRRLLRVAAVATVCGLAGAVPAAVADSAPVSTALPTISGVPQVGQTLTAQSGSWSGTGPIVLGYQWQVCNGSGAGCGAISGATGQTYTIAASDVTAGATVRVAVTASNATGTSTVLSDPTATVSAANAPLNRALPSISGTAQQGATLTATSGSWSGTQPISYAYQWQRCDANGADCVPVAAATGQSYLPVKADVGDTLRVQVTAANPNGSTPVVSGSSSVIASLGSAPANTAAPALSGSLLEGSTLTLGQGSWQGATPIGYSYGWQRCDAAGSSCSPISGVTAASYTLVSADVANRLRGVVTATNPLGSTTAYTTLTPLVASTRQPVNTALPAITGTAAAGQALTASTGTWTGATPIQYSYQWARGNAQGGYDPIPQATQQTYAPSSADVGHPLYVQVKAQNSYGPAWATSTATATVTGTPPPPGAIPVNTVSLPDRLVIAKVAFTPLTLTNRQAFQARFLVEDSNGHPVQGALVYELGLPYRWVRNGPEQETGATGWATVTIAPTANLPLGHPGDLVLFARARKPGGSLLAGVSTRRLIQIRIR